MVTAVKTCTFFFFKKAVLFFSPLKALLMLFLVVFTFLQTRKCVVQREIKFFAAIFNVEL